MRRARLFVIAVTTMFLTLAVVLVVGCTKDNPVNPDNPEEEINMVAVSCTVDLQGGAREGLSVMSSGSGFSLESDSSQLNVIENTMPQLLVVADEDDHVRMLYRNVLHEGQTVVINPHTTALAMVTCHPFVAMIGDSDYATMTSIIEHLQTFPTFESMVNASIAAGGNIFDTNNTQMMQSIQLVFEELLGIESDSTYTEKRKDTNPLPWADYKPLRFEWVDQSQGKFSLSNYSLVPTYYGTISTPEGREDIIVLPTVSSYTFIGVIIGATRNLLWNNADAFYGDRVKISLTRGTTNTIELTNLHNIHAIVDFGARLVGDIIGTFGFPLPDGFRKEMAEQAGGIVADAVANVTENSDHAIREIAKSIWNGVYGYIKGKVAEGIATGTIWVAATKYDKEWAKRIMKIGVNNIFKWYNMAEGGTNLSMRIYYYIKYPKDISFCINYGEDNVIGQCCDCNLTSGDWVDLGLPSGLLWATRNVGASSPTGYGDYFAWGETVPKNVYEPSTYQYYDNYYRLTKYCCNASYGHDGFTDGRTTLEPGDDAATANYGGRTPTKEEWEELYQNTTHHWTTINGVNGRCFTGSNGNSIFLPASGMRANSNLLNASTYGYYWSSVLVGGNNRNAWFMGFNSNFVGIYDSGIGERPAGKSVRAVRSANKK